MTERVYNGYPAKAQQKCLALSRRHFKKVVKLEHGNNPDLGLEFLDLIDEAFAQHRQFLRNPRREPEGASQQRLPRLSNLDSSVQIADNPEYPAMDQSSWIRGG